MNRFLSQSPDEVVVSNDYGLLFFGAHDSCPHAFQPRLLFFLLVLSILAELILEEGFHPVFDLGIQLVGDLCLVDELMLQLEGVNDVNYLLLLDWFSLAALGARLRPPIGRCRVHLELLYLVEALVDLAGLVHEVFELRNV